MKLLIKILSVLVITMLTANFQSCSKDDKDNEPAPVPEEATLTLSASELMFDAEGNERQTINIRTNQNWQASSDESWIDLSPRNGQGDSSLTITVNSANSTSSTREGIVRITAGGLTKEIVVKQKPGLIADCEVIIDETVTLGDQFGFTVRWGRKAAYFQWIPLALQDVKRYSDAEILKMLEKENRVVEDEFVFHYCISLDGEYYLAPNTDYVVFTVAHDDKGNIGELKRHTIRTRGLKDQALAYISDLEWNGSKWLFTTTMNPYIRRYYKLIQTAMEDEYDLCLANYPDIVAAYFINEDVKENSPTPAIQNSSWYYTPAELPYFFVATWGKDEDGEWSGVIDTAVSASFIYQDSPASKRIKANIKNDLLKVHSRGLKRTDALNLIICRN